MMSKRTWDKLPGRHPRDPGSRTCGAGHEREYVKSFEKDLMEKLQRENGVTVFRALT